MEEASMPDRVGRLNRIPRVTLGYYPTPLEAMPNLAAELGTGPLHVKRDDCTGLAFGGNKVRQLEFYLGDAVSKSADTILITGAVQSNFVRLAAAAARKLGMDCHIQLEQRVPKTDPVYQTSGNVLLDEILGATIHSYPEGEDEEGADRRLAEIAADLKRGGRTPYVIPLTPGHLPLGALGYVVAAEELVTQLGARDLTIDEIVVPSGSGNTHAGLLFGLRALGCCIPVTGVCVRRDAGAQFPRIHSSCLEIADLLEMPPVVGNDDITLIDDVLAPGYGQLNDATVDAIRRLARSEGLILDPVYSGKTMAGLIERARRRAGSSLLFVHTGGTPAVFAYGHELVAALGNVCPDTV
jgi:D-cysteine desulfhydrase/L-cysteate sulfo-lyase